MITADEKLCAIVGKEPFGSPSDGLWGMIGDKVYTVFYYRTDCPLLIYEYCVGTWYINSSDTFGNSLIRETIGERLGASSGIVPLPQRDMVWVYEAGGITGLITKGERNES